MAAKSGPPSLEPAQGMNAQYTHLYGPLISSTMNFQSALLQRAITAEKAMVKIVKIATTKRPRTQYHLGPDAAFTLPLRRILSARLIDPLITR